MAETEQLPVVKPAAVPALPVEVVTWLQELVVSGYELREIVKLSGLPTTQVRRALAQAHTALFREVQSRREEWLGKLYVDHEWVKSEAANAWEESKPMPLADALRSLEGGQEEPQLVPGRQNYPAGDARYLNTYLDALKAQRQMLGFESGRGGGVNLPGGLKPPEDGKDYKLELYQKLTVIQSNLQDSQGVGQRQAVEPGQIRRAETEGASPEESEKKEQIADQATIGSSEQNSGSSPEVSTTS